MEESYSFRKRFISKSFEQQHYIMILQLDCKEEWNSMQNIMKVIANKIFINDLSNIDPLYKTFLLHKSNHQFYYTRIKDILINNS